MSPKLIRIQCSLHIAEKKYACTLMLRSTRALPRCISQSAHACTSLEARVHAYRADRTQKSDNSDLFKHKKYGKHAQTESSHRHGQGMGHAGTKGLGKRHRIELSEVERATILLTFVSQYILVVVRPPRLTCNSARAYATRCVSSPVRALWSWEDWSAIACARTHSCFVWNASFVSTTGNVWKEGEEGCACGRSFSCGMCVSSSAGWCQQVGPVRLGQACLVSSRQPSSAHFLSILYTIANWGPVRVGSFVCLVSEPFSFLSFFSSRNKKSFRKKSFRNSTADTGEGWLLKGLERKKKDIRTARQVNHDLTSWFCCYWCSTLFNYNRYSFFWAFFDLIE